MINPYTKRTKLLLEKALKCPEKIIHDNDFLNKLEDLITLDYIKAIQKIIYKFNIKPELIALHGQTIYHKAEKKISVQLANAKIISEKFKVDVVYNFRKNDLLNGGQGAPIAPIYHKAIIEELKLSLPSAIINIGGISNLTYWDGYHLIGFDTGPGNSLMDKYMKEKLYKEFDNNGQIALQGSVNHKAVKRYSEKSFIKKNYPKSLDRSDILSNTLWKTLEKMSHADSMSTLCFITAKTIQINVNLLPKKPENILICGGGQNNLTLISMLKQILRVNILTSRTANLDGNYFESELMGFLGARKIFNLPSTFPSTTGASKDIICGEIITYK